MDSFRLLSLALLGLLLGACTESDPLYCDKSKPCTAVGQICDYAKRSCVAATDARADVGGSTGEGGPREATLAEASQ
jgi:hypothetical protein